MQSIKYRNYLITKYLCMQEDVSVIIVVENAEMR